MTCGTEMLQLTLPRRSRSPLTLQLSMATTSVSHLPLHRHVPIFRPRTNPVIHSRRSQDHATRRPLQIWTRLPQSISPELSDSTATRRSCRQELALLHVSVPPNIVTIYTADRYHSRSRLHDSCLFHANPRFRQM